MGKLKSLGKEKVNEILDKYVKEGKIDKYYLDKTCYGFLPFAVVDNNEISLYKITTYCGSDSAFTIYDYETEASVIKMLDTIVENKDLIKIFSVREYKTLLDILWWVEDYENDGCTKEEAIERTKGAFNIE